MRPYLACVEVANDLDDNLVLLVGGLLAGDHHLRSGQVLELINLPRGGGRVSTSTATFVLM